MGNMIRHILTDGFGGSQRQKEVVSQVAKEENISPKRLERLLLCNKYQEGKLFDYSPNDLRELIRVRHPWDFEEVIEEEEEEWPYPSDDDWDYLDSPYD